VFSAKDRTMGNVLNCEATLIIVTNLQILFRVQCYKFGGSLLYEIMSMKMIYYKI
jgi:hypothetical protein